MKNLIYIVLFFSQALCAAEYGVFMVVKGKVRVEGAKPMDEVKVGARVEVGDTIVTEGDSRAKVVMSDRNIINISPNSRLKIEKYSNAAGDKNVDLNLIEGKVRNDVEQKYDNKSSHFEVHTATAVAGVRGTKFITSFDSKTKVTEVITLRGVVSFRSAAAAGANSEAGAVLIRKGEKSEAGEGAAPAVPVKVPDKDIKAADSETAVKKDKGTTGSGGDASVDAVTVAQPGNMKGALDDLKNSNDQVKQGQVERKFDKAKVKIITKPAN